MTLLSGAFIKKKGVEISYKSKIGMVMLTSPTLTDEIMKDIDSPKNGTGSMVLIRYFIPSSGNANLRMFVCMFVRFKFV